MNLLKPHTGAGAYVDISTTGERYRAFMPQALPANPPLSMEQLLVPLEIAPRTLAALDSQAALLPHRDLFIYMLVRKEALLSSHI